jgi:uncharacterized protein (UPF0248 family)
VLPKKLLPKGFLESMLTYPRQILNRLKWKDGSLNRVKVTYVHRGASGDRLTIPAENITRLGHSFFSTADSEIPYHRIVRIERDGVVLFDINDFEKKEIDTT